MKTASSILWVTIRTDRDGHAAVGSPRSIKSVRSASAVSTSRAEKGSSMSRISGWTTSALAKPTRWRIPPESSFG